MEEEIRFWFIFNYQDVTAVSLPRAQMCLIAPEEGSVLTMTYASARRTGPEKTVPRSPVDLSTIAPVIYSKLCILFSYLITHIG